MTPATLWWIAAGALVAAELATGTFYLLMLALGAAAAALAALLGADAAAQAIVGAAVGGSAVVGWHRWRLGHPRPGATPLAADPDLLIDIGQAVEVERWHADGSARVRYRGAQWQARFGGSGGALPGPHVIRAIEGSTLVLDRP